ncbi:MAG: LysR family transcriptional regulator, partial [Bacteroidota bacterium]
MSPSITYSNQLELRQIRYFLALAREKHFGKAAEQVYISQPGLSRQIKRMEEALGLSLLIRDSRNVALTQAGQYLAHQFEQVLVDLERHVQHAHQLETGLSGVLRLGYLGSAMQEVIPKLLLAIRQGYPSIQFDLRPMDNPQQLEALLKQEIDLGFVRLDKVPPKLTLHPLITDTFSLVLPAEHPLDATQFRGLAQVKDEPFILFDPSYSQSYFDTVMELFYQAGFEPISAHKTVHPSTIYRLVENGFGLSIVPSSLAQGYDLNIKFIELDQVPQRTTLQLVWNSSLSHPIMDRLLPIL